MTTCDCPENNHKLGCPQQPESRESYRSAMRLLAQATHVDPDLNPERLLAALLARYEELADEALAYGPHPPQVPRCGPCMERRGRKRAVASRPRRCRERCCPTRLKDEDGDEVWHGNYKSLEGNSPHHIAGLLQQTALEIYR